MGQDWDMPMQDRAEVLGDFMRFKAQLLDELLQGQYDEAHEGSSKLVGQVLEALQSAPLHSALMSVDVLALVAAGDSDELRQIGARLEEIFFGENGLFMRQAGVPPHSRLHSQPSSVYSG